MPGRSRLRKDPWFGPVGWTGSDPSLGSLGAAVLTRRRDRLPFPGPTCKVIPRLTGEIRRALTTSSGRLRGRREAGRALRRGSPQPARRRTSGAARLVREASFSTAKRCPGELVRRPTPSLEPMPRREPRREGRESSRVGREQCLQRVGSRSFRRADGGSASRAVCTRDWTS